MNTNLNYNFHKKNDAKVKKNNGGVRSGSSSRRVSFTDAYDTDLSSDVESVIHPFCARCKKTANNHVGASRFNTLKYFTLVVVFFPSVIAVVVPSGDVDTSTGDFIANAITDALMIFIVSWSVKTAVEWPWDWLSQL
ncbi:hypothetical protein G9P44_005149 [Scheffersomyces stipitis]|nr:hypothetical protein G9P44_005149 [Scheffersomyces stipitis]